MKKVMLGLSLRNRVPNTEVWNWSGVRDAIAKIWAVKWNYAGHLAREKDHRWTREITGWRPRDHHLRSKCRPPTRWSNDLKRIHTNWINAEQDRGRLMSSRKQFHKWWKMMIQIIYKKCKTFFGVFSPPEGDEKVCCTSRLSQKPLNEWYYCHFRGVLLIFTHWNSIFVINTSKMIVLFGRVLTVLWPVQPRYVSFSISTFPYFSAIIVKPLCQDVVIAILNIYK